jgi:hypothetical protein
VSCFVEGCFSRFLGGKRSCSLEEVEGTSSEVETKLVSGIEKLVFGVLKILFFVFLVFDVEFLNYIFQKM